MVHFNKRYGSFQKARDQPLGLVVLSVLLKLSAYENALLSPITDALPSIVQFNSSSVIRDPIHVAKLLPNDDAFFRYPGSLTTPPCSETVTHIVFANPITISANQVHINLI